MKGENYESQNDGGSGRKFSLTKRMTGNPDADGAGYGAIPYFEGGVGMSSFVCVFNACGFVLEHSHETDKTCYYYFVKKSQDV